MFVHSICVESLWLVEWQVVLCLCYKIPMKKTGPFSFVPRDSVKDDYHDSIMFRTSRFWFLLSSNMYKYKRFTSSRFWFILNVSTITMDYNFLAKSFLLCNKYQLKDFTYKRKTVYFRSLRIPLVIQHWDSIVLDICQKCKKKR